MAVAQVATYETESGIISTAQGNATGSLSRASIPVTAGEVLVIWLVTGTTACTSTAVPSRTGGTGQIGVVSPRNTRATITDSTPIYAWSTTVTTSGTVTISAPYTYTSTTNNTAAWLVVERYSGAIEPSSSVGNGSASITATTGTTGVAGSWTTAGTSARSWVVADFNAVVATATASTGSTVVQDYQVNPLLTAWLGRRDPDGTTGSKTVGVSSFSTSGARRLVIASVELPVIPVTWAADLSQANCVAAGFEDDSYQRQNNAGTYNDNTVPWPVPTVTASGGRAGRMLSFSIPSGYRRYEVIPAHRSLEAGESSYFGIAVRFPAGFPIDFTGFQIFDQLHQASGNWSPPVSFEARSNGIRLTGGYGLTDPANPNVGQHDQQLVANPALDTWHSLVYRVSNFSTAANVSKIDVWWNGTQVLTNWTLPCPTLLANDVGETGTYRKCGIYRTSSNVTALTIEQTGHAAGPTYAAVDPAAGNPPLSTVSSDFTAAPAFFDGNFGGAAVTGGQAVVPTVNTYAALATTSRYTLAGSAAYVQVVTASGVSGTRQNSLKLEVDATNSIEMMLDGGVFKGRVTKAGAPTDVALGTYSAVTHAWWRIREAAGTAYWDTSTDGITWTNRGSAVHALTITSVRVLLQAGYYGTETGAVSAVYDNFNVVPSSGVALTQTVTDAAGAADTATRAGPSVRVVADTAAVADTATTVAAVAAAVPTDVALTTDVVSRTTTTARTPLDTAGAADSVSFLKGLNAATTDAIGVGDSGTQAQFGLDPFGQAPFGGGDPNGGVSRTVDFQRYPVDPAAVDDDADVVSTSSRTVVDAAGAFDDVQVGGDYSYTLTDTADAVDELDELIGADVPTEDAIGVGDSVETESEYLPSTVDAIGVGDAQATVAGYARDADDAVGVSDTVSSVRGLAGEPVDALGVVDQVDATVHFTATFTDAAAASDQLERLAPVARQVVDKADAVDSRDIVGVGRITAPAETTNETDTAVTLTPSVSLAVPVAVETTTALNADRIAQANAPLTTEADTATAPRPTGSYPTEQAGEWDITFPPIVLVDDGEFGTAIDDVDRTPVYVLKADWNRNGLYDHPLSDLTSLVTNVSVSKALAGTLPAEVGIVEGYSSAELSVTLEGEIPTAFTQLDERRNLIVNPSFESNTIGWSSNGEHSATTMPRERSAIVSGVTVTPRFGSWYAYSRPTPGGGGGLVVYPSAFSATQVGQRHTGSIYVNRDGTNNVRLDIDWHNAAGTFLSTTAGAEQSPQSGTWTQLTTSGNAPGGATQGRIVARFIGQAVGAYARFDAALFEQATTVTAGSFFDGNSGGARWVGTVNNSVSVRGGVIGAPRNGREFDVIDAFAPYRPDAPLYGYPVLQTPIYLETGFLADDGPRLARRFTGTVAQIHPSSLARTVELRALDPVARLRATLTLSGVAMYESILARWGPEQYRSRMNSQWLIDYALRRNGIYTSPPCRDNAILSVTGHGSMIPEIGWGGAPQEYYPTYRGDVWQPGRFGGALCTVGGTVGRWWLTEQVTAASGAGFGFSQWMAMYPAGTANAADQYFSMDLTTNASWFINFGIGTDGRPYLGSQQTGQAEVRATPTGYAPPASGRWSFVGVHVTFAATQMTVRFRIDQTTYTSTVTIGSRPGNWKPGVYVAYRWRVPFQNFQLWKSTTVPGTPWQGEDANWVPQADLDPGVNELTGVPELLGVDSWELIKTITDAEGSTFQFDEFGRPQFRTSKGDQLYGRTKSVKETVSADRNLADLVSTTDESTIRNVINIKTKAQLISDWQNYYVSTDIDEFYTPANTTSYFELELPTAAYEIPPPLSTFGCLPDQPNCWVGAGGTGFVYFSPASSWSAVAKQDYLRSYIRVMVQNVSSPTNWVGSGVQIRVVRLSPWKMQVIVNNQQNHPIRFATPREVNEQGVITSEGEPALIIPARIVEQGIEQLETYTDNGSVTIYGPSSFDVGGSDDMWRQAPQGFRSVATEVLSTTAHPVPVLESTDTPHDPRRKLGDQVVLRDPDGLGEVTGGIVALTQTFTNGPAIDQVVVRPNGPPV